MVVLSLSVNGEGLAGYETGMSIGSSISVRCQQLSKIMPEQSSPFTKHENGYSDLPCCTPGTLLTTIQPESIALTISRLNSPLSQPSNCLSGQYTSVNISDTRAHHADTSLADGFRSPFLLVQPETAVSAVFRPGIFVGFGSQLGRSTIAR